MADGTKPTGLDMYEIEPILILACLTPHLKMSPKLVPSHDIHVPPKDGKSHILLVPHRDGKSAANVFAVSSGNIILSA